MMIQTSMMILPRPRNPPYRIPTPKNSPPPDQDASPKRKRTDQSQAKSAPLCVNTAMQRDMTPEAGVHSPRTKIAERLQDLTIRQLPSHDGELPSSSQSPRKRLKRNPHVRDVYQTPGEVCTPGRERTPWEVPDSLGPMEVFETPASPGATMSSSPPVSPTTALKAFQNPPQGALPIPTSSPPTKRRLSSPPLPSSPGAHRNSTTTTPLPTSSLAPSDPDLSALTWHESEITGHEIDTTSPDDDGEGINGIGFRPTAAMAYARSQKRRKAVEEWKAREAREARQRRINRRRRGTRDLGVELEGEGEGKRSVRFVGVG